MKIIVWNCQGLGAARAVHELTNLVKINHPKLLFLTETKRNSNEMKWLKYRWGFEGCFTVDCQGRARGLVLLWDEEVNVRILSYSNRHINVSIGDNNVGDMWRFTRIYGHLKTRRRYES